MWSPNTRSLSNQAPRAALQVAAREGRGKQVKWCHEEGERQNQKRGQSTEWLIQFPNVSLSREIKEREDYSRLKGIYKP